MPGVTDNGFGAQPYIVFEVTVATVNAAQGATTVVTATNTELEQPAFEGFGVCLVGPQPTGSNMNANVAFGVGNFSITAEDGVVINFPIINPHSAANFVMTDLKLLAYCFQPAQNAFPFIITA